MTKPKCMHILFLTAEQWPTFRADVNALFGKYLPRNNITCDLVTERDSSKPEALWPAGSAILCNLPKHRAAQYIVKFWHQCYVLLTADYKQYDAVQVRDMTLIALLALLVAKLKGIHFYYWLSYPQSEGQIQRARARGWKAGMRYWFPLLQGNLGQMLLYKAILPRANHIFVQSEKMQRDVAKHGVGLQCMTPVPMGVDLEMARPDIVVPSDDVRLVGKRVLVYLGTLDRVRRIEVLFEMLAIVKQQFPNVLLVVVGDTEDSTHREWLKEQTRELEVEQHVLWAGWLAMDEGWRYVRAAEIGLSPIPRGYLLDMGSPTKAAEYMAFGVPVVGNDNPDQQQVIEESGAGLCVTLTGESFAEAVMELLDNPSFRERASELGKSYVAQHRGYAQLSQHLAKQYQTIISKPS